MYIYLYINILHRVIIYYIYNIYILYIIYIYYIYIYIYTIIIATDCREKR